jgi:hypothetical protein
MKRTMLGAILASACGPESAVAEESGAATSSADATDDGATTSTGGSVDTSSEGALDSTGSDGTTTEDASSTGDPFTFGPDETYVEIACGENGPSLWIEIYPGSADGECLPPPSIGREFALFLLEPWDGAGGTYEVGPDGPVRGGFGVPMRESPTGTLSIEVVAPWTVASATIDVATSEVTFAGTADLSECAPSDGVDPCDEK